MKLRQIFELDPVDEGWRRTLATTALAAAAAYGAAHGNKGHAADMPTPQPQAQSSQMPNLNIPAADNVSGDADFGRGHVIVSYSGKGYQGVFVKRDGSEYSPGTNAVRIKVQQSQVGERGIGNYTTYLDGDKAYILYNK